MSNKQLNFIKGAEWRRWDLHIHTPGTKKNDQYKGSEIGEKWNNFINTINDFNEDISVIGITDYLSIENYFKFRDCIKNGEIIKRFDLIIPNIELRIQPVTKKDRPINIHCLFNPEIDKELETRFFGKLKFDYKNSNYSATRNELIRLGKNFEGNNNLNEEVAIVTGINQFIISLDNLQDIFRDDKDLKKNTIIVVSNSSQDGVSGIIKHSDYFIDQTKSQLDATRQNIYYFSDMVFSSNINDINYFIGKGTDSKEIVLNKCGSLMPCIHGSDAHCNEKLFSVDNDKYCWIKADPTFQGLKQVLNEPECRVFIGRNPDILIKSKENPTKFISEIIIDKNDLHEGAIDEWFNKIKIPFNDELIAIIGNKGSGKSALADILGLCGNSKNQDKFSFLAPEKFRKNNLANKFITTLKWKSGNEITKTLSDNIDHTENEKIKYLPQGYFEELCNEIERNNKFQNEIENVIFQYIEEKDRLNQTKFEDLINFKKKSLDIKINSLKEKLKNTNTDIIKLEKKNNESYKKEISNKLKSKKEELDAHMKIKPKEINNPNNNGDISYEQNLKIELINKSNYEYEKLKSNIKELENQEINLNTEAEELKNLIKEIEMKKNDINNFLIEKKEIAQRFDLKIETIFSIQIDIESINKLIEFKNNKILEIGILLGSSKNKNKDIVKKLAEQNVEIDLIKKLNELENYINNEKESLDKPAKEYQEYLKNLKKWEEQKISIEGDIKSFDSLRFFEHELDYLQKNLLDELNDKKIERINISFEIFNSKSEIIEIYKNIKKNLDVKLIEYESYLNEYKIDIDASFSINKEFESDFSAFINKRIQGSFWSTEGCKNQLKEIIENKDINKFEDITDILNKIIDYLCFDKRESQIGQIRNIDDQISKLEDFYFYLFSLDFFKENYNLKSGGKKIEQLSPGEKGALLLVFYLLLDKSDTPLIIDQPEDNLDNQSVAKILVPFIKEAKKRRQIIIVTHNPNLAIVADAEQIIYVNIEKKSNNKFIFISGSIENPLINECIVNVLEGTMPAFDLRNSKYHRNIKDYK